MSDILTAATPTTTPKFHFSLWVADLQRTVAFYRVLFGQEPHKVYPDYAKFEVADPPLVLSFLPQPAPRGASLNHVGLRLPDAAGLVEVQRRLERAGYTTIREDGVECCYALQTKFWVKDPDGVSWEVYAIHQDIGHHGRPNGGGPATPIIVEARDEAVGDAWTHTLPDPLLGRIPVADESLGEVRLLNTFNAPGGALAPILAEAMRVLRPGGRLVVRGLVGARPHPGTPDFPGLWAKYNYVPVPTEPLSAMTNAGFRGVEIATWKDVCCVSDSTGVRFRIVELGACKPSHHDSSAVTARYDGPFTSLVDDDGTVFTRGTSVTVLANRARILRDGPAGPFFTFAGLT